MKEFKYKINGAPYRVVVTRADSEIVELEVNGTPYTVEIEQKAKKPKTMMQRHRLPESETGGYSSTTPFLKRPAGQITKNSVISPLPGTILDVRFKVGDSVKKGDVLMILEAMKMENNILSDGNGKILEILVQNGDSVLEGADLVVIEYNP